MTCEQPCLETILGESTTNPDAATVLRGLHQFYSEGAVTLGDPIPLINCPLQQCNRDRVIEFTESGIAAEDDDNRNPCIRGLSAVILERTALTSDQPPGPSALAA